LADKFQVIDYQSYNLLLLPVFVAAEDAANHSADQAALAAAK
jgi:hypothetical protein